MLKGILQYVLIITLFLGVIVTIIQLEEMIVRWNIFCILFTIGVAILLIIANWKPKDMKWIKIGYALVCAVGVLYITHEIAILVGFVMIHEQNLSIIAIKQLAGLLMIISGILGYLKSSEFVRKKGTEKESYWKV